MTKKREPKPPQPTNSQWITLGEIKRAGGCFVEKQPDASIRYVLLGGGREMDRDKIERLIARGWLKGNDDGLLPGVPQTFMVVI